MRSEPDFHFIQGLQIVVRGFEKLEIVGLDFC